MNQVKQAQERYQLFYAELVTAAKILDNKKRQSAVQSICIRYQKPQGLDRLVLEAVLPQEQSSFDVHELLRDDGGKRLSRDLWQSVRQQVFKRDNFTCQYCGAKPRKLHCDHILPVSRGGSNDLSNLTTACQSCNLSKHDKTVAEWRPSLLSKSTGEI